ncbi:hypothetical protein BX616_002359 [Lobosporangium transversale]|uniref:RING-type E3 ubiquitin transferase n=1 Tax=Lobosporangium transversale TaxID=64571 RepID=A0A1Y2GFK7_9FUNG|nr:hypothetical protein BCR41DRAFT_424186 [Lobosporangium transversale]KAF9901157.1 hypothetical protein BX616_002359 [Lobosporangium transversale]ORZ09400.1 hypothetical protein BCR41DRAFT_424186 [Lobosporangium transversale]|eukprot:XP_021878853.1 hypothetical protein BCR41DRAFT_424186 [Lobosporangium transversale]
MDNSSAHDDAAAVASPRPRHEFWCHQCAVEITPLMVPHPLCPECHSEFVEKIEEDNDPRNFVENAGEDIENGDEQGHIQLFIEDLQRMVQLVGLMRPVGEQASRPRARRSEDIATGDHSDSLTLLDHPLRSRDRFDGLTTIISDDDENDNVGDDGDDDDGHDSHDIIVDISQANGDPDDPNRADRFQQSRAFLISFLERMQQEMSPATESASDSPGHDTGLSGLFNMIGNPGDYVFSQAGLDDVITQLMEMQGRQNGPVGASDEIIESIPPHILTDEELAAKTECSVCKDEFTKEDNLLQLKCRHIFHEDCIKPWLKLNGTCPTCRFELVPQHGGHDNNQQRNSTSGGNDGQSSGQDNNAQTLPTPTGPTSEGGEVGNRILTSRVNSIPGAFPSSTRYSPFRHESNSNSTSSPSADDVD